MPVATNEELRGGVSRGNIYYLLSQLVLHNFELFVTYLALNDMFTNVIAVISSDSNDLQTGSHLDLLH